MKKQNLEIFFDKKAADGFDELIELITEPFLLFKSEGKDVEWNQIRDLSVYGFKLKSRSGKLYLFFGMYWHFWVDFGYPICITLESSTGIITEEDNKKFKLLCDTTLKSSCKYYNYEGLNICALNIDFINQDIRIIKSAIYEFYLNLQLINK
jgi:hypothetical protein